MDIILKKHILLSISAALIIAGYSGCGKNNPQISRPLLGTIVTVTITGDSADTPGDFNAAFTAIEQVQKAFNPNDPGSEVSNINKTAYLRPVRVSGEVYSLIARSLEVSEKTGGAFDITFASAGRLWDFSKDKFAPPDNRTVQKLLPLISYKNILLDEKTGSVRILRKGTKIGLGGIAKGYAVSRAAAALRTRKVKGAIVACAGDIQVIGNNSGKPWKAGIKDPRGDSIIGAIEMTDGEAVSTSGDYERFRIVNGKRYHHIIDPSTGYPSNSGLISVSVFRHDPVLSDEYSTSFFVSGLEKTKKILTSMNGLSVVMVTEDMKVYASMSLKGRVTFRDGLDVVYF